MIFAVAARGSAYCTACSVFLCLLLVSDDSPLTEPSESMVARVAVGKFVAPLCQAFVPVRCVWQKRGGRGLMGCPWHHAAPLPPCSSKTTMIRVEGWSGRGVKILFTFSACGARAIQYVRENPPQWRWAEGALYRWASAWYLTVTQGYLCLTCTTFLGLFLGS